MFGTLFLKKAADGRFMTARPRSRASLAGWFYLAVLLALPGPVLAAGMDCAKAKAPVEQRICADPALLAADAAVAEAFATAVAAAQDPAAVRASQRQWLVARNACPDAACLRTSHAERRAALLGLAAAPAAVPAAAPETGESTKAAGVAAPGAANASGKAAGATSPAPAAPPAGAGSTRDTLLAERAAFKTRLNWPADCEASFQETYAPDGVGLELLTNGVDRYDLGQGRSLYLIQCDQAAYQSVYVAMATVTEASPARLLRFPTADADGGRITRSVEESLVGNPEFNNTAKTLTNLTKSRGVGDCGTFAIYAFAANGDPQPLQIRARDCPKNAAKYLPPEQWPLVKMP